MYEVAVDAPLNGALTYGPPKVNGGDPSPPLPIGVRVLVPLGTRLVVGYLVGRSVATTPIHLADSAPEFVIKPLVEPLDTAPLFPASLSHFFQWLADYYHYPLFEVIKTGLPAGFAATLGKAVLTPTGASLLAAQLVTAPNTKKETAWQTTLCTQGELSAAALKQLRRRPRQYHQFKKMVAGGWVTLDQQVRVKKAGQQKEWLVSLGEDWADQLGPPTDWCVASFQATHGAAVERLSQSAQKTLFAFLTLGQQVILQVALRKAYARTKVGLVELVAAGFLKIEARLKYRDPFGNLPAAQAVPIATTPHQQQVLEQLLPVINKAVFHVFLLHGVTGSGKTEVYLRAAAAALSQGKTVLLLVPEIALSSQLEAHFYGRFGDQLAVIHSGLSQAQRCQQWQRVMAGAAQLVIGARSAIFSPLENIGLIIVDEEHESAYKQDNGLRYQGRDMAVLRGKLADCPVILGSATPSVISRYHAKTGKYTLLEMPTRIYDKPLPTVELIDLALVKTQQREERRQARREERRQQREAGKSKPPVMTPVADKPPSEPPPISNITPLLATALAENLAAGHQSLLFVNRRGYAGFMLCRDCGDIVRCRHCQVSLTHHKQRQRLICHYCGYSLPAQLVCPNCRSSSLIGLSAGSEQLEEEVRTLLPGARVARLDSDTAKQRHHYLTVLKAVRERQIDILVGTQMIAKGLHFPGMTLVGVVWADSGLGIPDFRASEKTFQLLAQVTGRAGRGEEPGRVIIQTHQPEHYAIAYASTHDYDQLFEKELALRESLAYPPFSRLVNVRITGHPEAKVKTTIQAVTQFLRRAIEQRGQVNQVELLGPAPAPLVMIRNKVRWQCLIKSSQLSLLHALCHLLLAERKNFCSAEVNLTVDVDPESMM